MYRPTPYHTDKLTCDICGKPAKWRDRVFMSSYRLGEALCDECEERTRIYFMEVEKGLNDNKAG